MKKRGEQREGVEAVVRKPSPQRSLTGGKRHVLVSDRSSPKALEPC
jgi:hypothetical protein